MARLVYILLLFIFSYCIVPILIVGFLDICVFSHENGCKIYSFVALEDRPCSWMMGFVSLWATASPEEDLREPTLRGFPRALGLCHRSVHAHWYQGNISSPFSSSLSQGDWFSRNHPSFPGMCISFILPHWCYLKLIPPICNGTHAGCLPPTHQEGKKIREVETRTGT